MDDEQRYQAASSKDARFDGVFFTAVRTTGIYCRPSCPAITPKRANVTFYPTAAAAQQAGYRACKRCRPDASPGSPEWNVRSDVAGRAMRLIADGSWTGTGCPGWRPGSATRHARSAGVLDGRGRRGAAGARPRAAGADRADPGRDDVLPMGDIAFAAGFTSIRQFNATMLEVYDTPPSVLRERAARRRPGQGADRRAGPSGRAVPAAAVPAADRPGPDASGTWRRGRCPGSRWSPRPNTQERSVFRTDPGLLCLRPVPGAELGGVLAGAV